MKSRLIVIDGIDGCGKGTQINMLKEKLKDFDVIFSHEPGGTKIAEEIKELILKEKSERVPAETDFFLFWASRMLHIENVIEPALRNYKSVITDRFDSSSFAFQIYGEENFQILPLFHTLHDEYIKPLNPAYIFFDLKPEVAYERMEKDLERENNSFDLKPIDYHRRVRKGFRLLKEKDGEECYTIDVDRDVERINSELFSLVASILALEEN